MKFKIHIENSFEKDLKKLKKRNKDITKLKTLIELLEQGIPLPEKHRNHKLIGNYKDLWECHIEPDWLLIYRKIEDTIVLVKSGTHSDFF